ncbi:MAG: division/cell wall cluster transcriptional repressor MraZ [Acidimicrobiia bacterium]|jgi:MraZ protein|nr:MAG: division/cell wall cluster transcriptional repressor MraZ [Acidimicrobiia bacterium]
MFIGEYHHSLDEKGRLVLPAKFRAALADDGTATGFVSKGQERCLYIQPEDEWRTMAEKVKALPLTDKRGRAFSRGFFGSSESIQVDGQGRVMIPGPLREWAGLTDKAVLVGLLDRIEVWDPEVWATVSAESDDFYTTIEEKITHEDL